MNARLLLLPLLLSIVCPIAQAGEVLGAKYESAVGGIVFRPPAEMQQTKKETAEDVASFALSAKGWELRVRRTTFVAPQALKTPAKPTAGSTLVAPDESLGMLDRTIDQVKLSFAGATVLRNDVVLIGRHYVGMIAMRYTSGTVDVLLQEAIVQANERDFAFFILTTPGAGTLPSGQTEDPREAEAVQAFRQMLDTVEVLDRSKIREDQNERLYRTRALYVLLTPDAIRTALVPQSYLRMLKDGKDIGYSYVVEEPETLAGNSGFHVGIRTRLKPEPTRQVDTESWQFVAFDRKNEHWTLVGVTDAGTAKSTMREYGTSKNISHTRLDPNAGRGDKVDPNQPLLERTDAYSLTVNFATASRRIPPIDRPLPPFYLPQAMAYILPRLLPLEQPKTYLFANYVGDKKEVMLRYVDIGREEVVMLNDQPVRAVPVISRLGLEGSAVTDYVTRAGKWLGRVDDETKITTLPTDAATLEKIWSKPDFSRPQADPAASGK